MPSSLLKIFADPIAQFCVLIVAGTLISRLMLRRRQAGRLIGQTAFFIALSVLLLYNGIIPYEPSPVEADIARKIFVGFAKIVWWVNGAWVLVAFVRIFLILERKPREGRLVQDLVVGIIYLGATLSIVSNVFSVPIGTLIATSGVFAIILGLALQSTLNDVFSGIALNLNRPYTVGDWVVLDDDIQGRIVETNWRSTHLLNGTNDLVVIPNSALAKARLTNLSSPDESHGLMISVRIVPTVVPRVITDLMRNVLLSSNSILKFPEPTVMIDSIDGQAIHLTLSCRIKDISMTTAAKNEIYDLIYRHTKSSSLRLADPVGSVSAITQEQQADGSVAQHPGTPWRLLSNVPLFSSLTEDEKETLANNMTRRTFHKDSVIAEQEDRLKSLMIVRTGVVIVSRREGVRQIELGRLAPGDYFGEGGVLMGAGEVGTLRALTFVVIYEISEACLAPLIRDRPSIAEELGLIMSRRIDAERHLFADSDILTNGAHPGSLTSRIRHLFQLQHD
ncbi:mechanosensitive ion channel family protein [Rhizobium sp. BK376]|uniref:mechanosensitive ion channel family protein n=1 Tax=Rhizobium sp. BK376 TaxID=2512149 RepID=UPI0010DF7940|nr:mechanosensitive ion channel family protein [Rhizobium sp. BK376]TCR81462.1 small-conductance mechanosensitive channel [Rhizobium sp. BK376]